MTLIQIVSLLSAKWCIKRLIWHRGLENGLQTLFFGVNSFNKVWFIERLLFWRLPSAYTASKKWATEKLVCGRIFRMAWKEWAARWLMSGQRICLAPKQWMVWVFTVRPTLGETEFSVGWALLYGRWLEKGWYFGILFCGGDDSL